VLGFLVGVGDEHVVGVRNDFVVVVLCHHTGPHGAIICRPQPDGERISGNARLHQSGGCGMLQVPSRTVRMAGIE
jgi:hypothetical protein